jgi:carbohydrate-binding DOMON domain-containing protein
MGVYVYVEGIVKSKDGSENFTVNLNGFKFLKVGSSNALSFWIRF